MITETKILNFLLLAERKNFSATAVATHISQQALSAQIASLEEDLGFALFIRNTKRVELTEAGERIRALWGEAVTQTRELQRVYSAQAQGVLKIAFFEDMNLSAPIRTTIERMSQKYPGLDCRFATRALFGEIESGLVQNDFDVAIIPNGYLHIRPEFKTQVLHTSTLYGYIQKDHPCAKPHMTMADVRKEYLFVGEEENSARPLIAEICHFYGFEPKFYTPGLVPSMERMMVEMGRGVGFGDEFSALYGNEKLACFPLHTKDPSVIAVWKRAASSPITRDFIAILRSAMKEMKFLSLSAGASGFQFF